MFYPFGLFPHPPPLFKFFSFFCCGFIVACCSCFNYIFIFPNIFFIFLYFLYLSNFILFFILCYCTALFFLFLFSFLFFLPHHVPCRIFVPRPQVETELQVQTTGRTENLRPQGILIRVRSPRGPHLSTKTRIYPTACKLQCWTPQAKQPVRQEYSPTHKRNNKKKCYKQRIKVKTYKTK